jgi:hypothetical protein
VELREATIAILTRWNLEQLARSPQRTTCGPDGKRCLLAPFGRSARRHMLGAKARRKKEAS